MTIQISTTVEQSKRLLEAGVPEESADMWWEIMQPLRQYGNQTINDGEPCISLSLYKKERIAFARYESIPSWSMANLWNIVHENMSALEYDTTDNPSKVMESLVYMVCWLAKHGRLKIVGTH